MPPGLEWVEARRPGTTVRTPGITNRWSSSLSNPGTTVLWFDTSRALDIHRDNPNPSQRFNHSLAHSPTHPHP
jgi:hypothetical protein